MAKDLLSMGLKALCQPLVPRHDPYLDWALLVALSLPHFLYAFIWLQPGAWLKAFGEHAVSAFATVAFYGKALQFQAFALWLWAARSQGLCVTSYYLPLWQWLAALLLVAFGQALNVGIYRAIGQDGVYYGFKLGKKVPWVSGFPFNVVPHPQYVGSSLTVWGAVLLLLSQVPPGSALQASLLTVGTYWTGLYVATGLMEQFL